MKKYFFVLLLIGYSPLFGQGSPIVPGNLSQVEPHVAYNPLNFKNLIATFVTLSSSQQWIGAFHSFDEGNSWTGNEQFSPEGAGDPVVAFDPDGTAYLLYQIRADRALYLHTSTDGGATWSAPVTVVQFSPPFNVDRPWMAVSPVRNASGFYDIYVAFYNDGRGSSSPIRIYRSETGGTPGSFQEWNSYSSSNPTLYSVQGVTIAVDYHNDVYVAYAETEKNQGGVERIIMLKEPRAGEPPISQYTVDANQVGTYDLHTGEWYVKNGLIIADSYPRLAVGYHPEDINRDSSFVYVVWADQLSTNLSDLSMVRGKTSGDTVQWSSKNYIVSTTQEEWMPAISVSPDGVITILYYQSYSDNAYPVKVRKAQSVDQGNSFTSTTVGTPFNVNNRVFLGDYHGVAAWYGKGYGVWSEYHTGTGNDPRQVYFGAAVNSVLDPKTFVEVTAKQSDASGQLFGNIDYWNQGRFIELAVPYVFQFEENSFQTLRAKQDFKPNTTEKYNNWNNDPDVTNHHVFTITGDLSELHAHFQPSYGGIVLKNRFLSAPPNLDPPADSIAFKDPWLIDYADPNYGNNLRNQGMSAPFKSRPSPFNPDYTTSYNGDVYKGVFLNQGSPNWQPPYYSVRALDNQQVTINGKTVTYDWESWSYDPDSISLQSPNSRTTAVVFKQDGATLTANLKGRRVSDAPQATAFNNSRKVLFHNYNIPTWYMVYEDRGHIYFTYSTDNGATWSKDEKVDVGAGGGNSQPTIAVEPISMNPRITVVWDYAPSGGGHQFQWRTKVGLNGSWGNQYSSDILWPIPTEASTQPAAIFGPGNVYILARMGSPEIIGLVLHRVETDNSLTLVGLVPGSDEYSQLPTITASPQMHNPLYFAWQQSVQVGGSWENHIFFNHYLESGGFSSAEQVTLPYSASDIEINQQPSISHGYDAQLNVVWSGFDTDKLAYVLLHRQRGAGVTGQWGPVNEVYYSYSNISQPSVGAYAEPYTGWLGVAVKFGSSSLRVIRYDTQNWSWLPNWYAGSHPGVNDRGDALMLTGTDHTAGLPYLIHAHLLPAESGLQGKPFARNGEGNSTEIRRHFRREMFALDSLPGLNLRGRVQVSVGDVHVSTVSGEQEWGFAAVSDSNGKVLFLQSAPLSVTDGVLSARLRYRVRVKGWRRPGRVPPLPLFRLRLVDWATGRPVKVLRQVALSQLSGTQFQEADSLTLDLRPFRGKTVVLQMQSVWHLIGNAGSRGSYMNVYEFYPPDSTAAPVLGKAPVAEVNTESLPRKFVLRPNYPNPFNPVTHVEFGIGISELGMRNSEWVTLKIYDILGREVKTLVNQRLTAGRYTVQWDGTDDAGQPVTSGVYLYRLQAGERIFTRKMVLMR